MMKAVVVAVYEEARAAVMHYSGSVESAEKVLNKHIAHFNDIHTQQRMYESFQQMNFPPEVEAKLVPHEQELLLDIIQFLEDHQASPELIELRDEVYALAK